MIPQGLAGNDLVQQAAKAKNNHWHLHMLDNGVPAEKFTYNYAPDGIHANHPQYNRRVAEKLEQLKKQLISDFEADDIEDVPADVVSAALQGFQNQLRTLIKNNPTTKINDLIIP